MQVQLLAKSISKETRDILATFLVSDFPKCLLAEWNTHKLMASNAESSRARPNHTVVQQVLNDPYVPPFTYNQPGMSGQFVEDPTTIGKAEEIWRETIEFNLKQSKKLAELGIHKQDCNRLLEPFLRVSVITTMGGVGWENFFKLRNHEAAQPAFQKYAAEMEQLYRNTPATELGIGDWHKPWSEDSVEVNTARAAGISYANHNRDLLEEDRLRIHDQLITSTPIHGSPLEHCAVAIIPGNVLEIGGRDYRVFDHFNPTKTLVGCEEDYDGSFISVAKFGGFLQYRKIVELGGSTPIIP